MREICTSGSIGRGLGLRAHDDGQTGTKPETVETAKPKPTGYRASPRPYRLMWAAPRMARHTLPSARDDAP